MTQQQRPLAGIFRDDAGSLVIETAFVLPILLLLCLGAVDVCQLVARNTELQSAMSEATAISLASRPRTQSEIDTIEDVIEASTGLADENVVFERIYRCGTANMPVSEKHMCMPGQIVAEFIEITMSETYTPIWTGFGIGSDVDFSLTRTVQIS